MSGVLAALVGIGALGAAGTSSTAAGPLRGAEAAALVLLLAQAPSAPAMRAPSPAPAPAAGTAVLSGTRGETQTGLAAYYSSRLQGRRTASGERFDNAALTTAHQTLPFGTRVKVTNEKNGKSVVLRVNDRGPTQPDRIVDVSRAAAQRIGFVRSGITPAKLEVVEAAKPRRVAKS
jgi:rare lipoprotein A